ncbi:MAG TPA: transglutaminase family protein [Bdellovibrionales bacterium]|nr:transglutaminase family protein [Bdellovibrionales bacterium]
MELKLLRNEDFGSLAALSVGVNSVLWPKEGVESCFRQIQFLGFEVLKNCENLNEAERWEALRSYIFEDRGFQLSSARRKSVPEKEILMKCVLDERVGHPLPIVFLLLHLAQFLDLPMGLIQARHHFLLKWVRSGKTYYLDLYNEGRALTDEELIQVLNRSIANLEVWSAKQLMIQYLELLVQSFENAQDLPQLHVVYNLLLNIDDSNTAVLGQRALLRQKLGFTREALSDLKRYFSFVEKTQSPPELQQAWLELEAAPEPPSRMPTDVLH